VGWFYQRTRRACRSAIPRYQAVIDTYPEYADYDEVLFRMSECLRDTGRAAEALPHVARLLTEFPNSRFAEPARQLHTELSRVAPAPPPPAPPTPASPQPGPGDFK
jgi:outer membrane protein assembly factor BamD (BamD/ComL family)